MNIWRKLLSRSVLTCVAVLSAFVSAPAISQSIADAFQYPLDTMPSPKQNVGEYYYSPFYGYHLGVDLPATPGTAVHAVANGAVVYRGWVECLGDAVVIEHTLLDGSKRVSVYYHIEKKDVVLGPTVVRGQVVGYVRKLPEECGTGNHLHFGMRLNAYMAGNDCRTHAWFYPGYTSLHVQSCQSPPLPKLKDAIQDQSDPRHAAILAEWDSDPLTFIKNNLPVIPTSPITYQRADDIGVQDIWTTSTYSFTGLGGGPGGGLNDGTLRVGGWGDLYYSLIQFDLSTLPATASKVELQLYMPQVTGAGTTALYLDRITTFWDWRTQGTGQDRQRLWWDDQPPTVEWTTLPAPIAGQWYTIDITTLYSAWKAGTYPNFGVELRPVGDGNNTWAEFVSSNSTDAAHHPRLVITP